MMIKTCMSVMVAAALLAGCSSILGFKDPKLEDTNTPPADAPVEPVDTRTDASIDTGPAACMPSACPFGCDQSTNACREARLSVFLTPGATIGNGFGGSDMNPDVRGGADTRCVAAAANFPALACNPLRVHAVLYVSGTDTLLGMASKYGIPTNAPVRRADDNVLVADTWDRLLSGPDQPPSSELDPTLAMIWTGANTTNHCANWTNGTNASSGTVGDATSKLATWTSVTNQLCNRTARLLCVCWSGGQ
ncbi:MAG TPA: hypothetical protein VFT22_01545 [Kofleriaceae bacterium]|nr:hypothetical protein [Kofleriaceae bacterium]